MVFPISSTRLRTSFIFLVSILGYLVSSLPGHAQVSSFYGFAQSAGTWSTITGGERLNTSLNAFDNQVYTVNIPEFFYDGSYYTTMYVSANGFITFDAAPAGTNYTPLSSTAGYAGAISVFGCNLANATSGTREIRYQEVGDELVVQWLGARRSGQTESIDLQIRLNTVTGGILFRYNNSSPADITSVTPQVGLRGPNNTFATNVNNRAVEAANPGPGYTWANTTPGTTNDSRCRYNQQAGRSPNDGQTYTWTPVCLPLSASATVATNCGTNSYTITVDVTSLGNATSVNIQSPIGTNVHTAVGTGSYVIGPIAMGTSRTVRVVHSVSSTCNVDLGTFNSPASTCITNGQCITSPFVAIPDNGCGAGNDVNAGIAISGFNNALATNVDLQSVELIVAHASRGQLQVTLTSPTGQTRNLVTSRGGNGDNLGDPTNCSSSLFILSDAAGTAVSGSGTGNNPTGSWRPEQTLAGFTGDPNGLWTVNICDGANGTTGTLRYAKLNFCDRVSVTATSNSPICAGASLQLGATVTGSGLTYAWTGTGTFSPNASSQHVTVTGAAAGTYEVTVSNGCSSATSSVVIGVNPIPVNVTAASSASTVCSNANTINLTGTGNSMPPAILSQNFNSGIAPWTTTNTSAGGTPANAAWTARANNYAFMAYDGNVTFSSNDASQFVLSNSDAQGGGTTTTTLVSPAFSTVGYTGASLSFHHYYRYNSGTDDRARVEVSTNGNTWTILETYASIQGAPAGFIPATVNLSGYLNQASVQVRFRYNASWDYFWAIDNVAITGTSATPTFAWTSTPAGYTSSLQNPTGIAVTQNTTYNLTVTGGNGCTATASTAVTHVPAASASIVYNASPYCASVGTVSVARTGTSGGTYTSTVGLSLNASTGAINATTSTPGTYTVTYTVAASAPCPQFQTTTNVTIQAQPTTAAAGADQSGCAVDAFTLAANAPSTGVGAWSVVSGPNTSNSQFSDVLARAATFQAAGSPGTYTLRWSITNGSCAASTDDVVITVAGCAYYSRATGAVSDPIWSTTPNGTAGPAVWDAQTNMVVQNGHTVTNTSDVAVGSITVNSGGGLVLGAFTLTSGGSLASSGSLIAQDNSTLALVGSGARTVALSAATSFWNLTCNTPEGTVLTGSASVRNTLLLEAGAFDCTGNAVALASTATSTGRLGPVGPTASYIGNLTVNRHIPAGATNWRMLGSPVAGQTVNQWKDDFYTAGFPGSHSPTFSSPAGSGNLWPSVRWYDETNTGSSDNDGLLGATSTAQPLAAGQGFAAWCGTGLTTTTAFNVDVTGNPHIAQVPMALPMTYTSTGVPATDGWNMVSNPLASPIAFDRISRGADVQAFVTYFNPANGNLATYDDGSGIGTNGGSNIIQSSQAFWLKANGPAVTTTVDEQAKVEGNSGGFFGGSQVQTANLVRLRIQSTMNQYSDETVVVFSVGEPEITSRDVPKFIFAHPDAPQIATQGDGGELIAINAYGPYSTAISIPVTVDVALSGDYTIAATGLHNIGLSCLRLEDLATNTVTPLIEGSTYTFTALATDDVNEARFVLHATAPLHLSAMDATCNGRDDGSASVTIGSGPVDITWTDAQGAVLLEQHGVMPGASDFVALQAGEYGIRITGDEACATLNTVFTIEEPASLEAEAITMPSTCPDSEDGTIDLTVLGGQAPYTYLWSNESADEDLVVAGGTYTVLITDANGCTFAPQEYVVGAGEGPDAGIAVASTLVLVGEELLFTPNTMDDVTNTWDFGDGNTSTGLEAVHSYTVPGSYTVTLSVDDGNCVSTASIVVDVQTSTAIAATTVGKNLNAWVSGDHIVVDHDFGGQHPVLIRVFSTGGQLAQEHRVPNAPARITLPTSDLASGIWMVRVSSGEQMRTFSLPVLH